MAIISRLNAALQSVKNAYRPYTARAKTILNAEVRMPAMSGIRRTAADLNIEYIKPYSEILSAKLRSAAAALEMPLGISEPEKEMRSGMKIAFAMGVSALATVTLSACGGDASAVSDAAAGLLQQGIEFMANYRNYVAGITAGLTSFSLASSLFLKMQSTSKFIHSVRPLNAAANFGAWILPYTLMPTALLTLGSLKNNFFEFGLLASSGLTLMSLVTNITTRFPSFKEFSHRHPRFAMFELLSNRLWKVGLFSAAVFGGIAFFAGSNDKSSFAEATEMFRFITGARELLGHVFSKDILEYKELTLPVILAGLAALHQYSIHKADTLPAQSGWRWPAEKLAFWGNGVYFLTLGTLVYLSAENNSTFSQIFSAWSPEVKDMLLDTAILGLSVQTYQNIKNSFYISMGKRYAAAPTAIILEHALANAQKAGKYSMLGIQVPMFLSLLLKMFAQDYSMGEDSLLKDYGDVLWNLTLSYATAYFAFNYVMVNTGHSTTHSLGSARDGQNSTDFPEHLRFSDAYNRRANQKGDGMRILNANMDPQATALVQIYKMLVNPAANIEYIDADEQHPHERIEQIRVMRSHFEYTDLVIQYQKEIYDFVALSSRPFFNDPNPGQNLARHYAALADIYEALGKRYTGDVADFRAKYEEKDFQPGNGSDLEKRPSYPRLIGHVEEHDQEIHKQIPDRYFKPQRDPYRYTIDGALRKRGDEMLETARALKFRAANKSRLSLEELQREYKYLHDIFSVPFIVNIRHLLKQDERNFNKISNLANAHTFEGDTLYTIWTISPDRDGKNPVRLDVEEIPSLYVCVRNPHYSHNSNETEDMRKYPYFWVHRDQLEEALKYSGSWSNELNHVDNTPGGAELGKLTRVEGINLHNGKRHATLEAFGAMDSTPLNFKKLVYRPGLTPSEIAEEEKRFRWTATQELSDAQWETFDLAFKTWVMNNDWLDAKGAEKQKKLKEYMEWIQSRREKVDKRELWYLPKPNVKFYLGSTIFDDPKVDTLDEEHLSIEFLEPHIQKDAEENAVVRIPRYDPLTRKMENPAPHLGTPKFADHYVADTHVSLTYEVEENDDN